MVFELPVIVLGLVSIGVLSSATLRKNRRLGYFVVAVVALGLPGPDPVTTGLELLPMWALFEGSIWLAFFVERARSDASIEIVSTPWCQIRFSAERTRYARATCNGPESRNRKVGTS